MSYLDHIKRCNTFTRENYIPFVVSGEQMGWSERNFVKHLLPFTSVFTINQDKLEINSCLDTLRKRSNAIAPILSNLHEQGVIDSWVDELYAVCHAFNDESYLLMERAAVSYFGVRGFGVHLNGLVQKSDGVYIWIARRTINKPFWPGKLDQLVAGGQPAGIGRLENVIKESAEEAAIPQSLASQAEYVGEIHYRGDSERGLSIDTLFNYDLWLPEDFVPKNTDGEVDEFILMPLEEMAHITDTTQKFKDNCNLVNIDMLLRRGLIDPSHRDFDEINNSLYAPAQLS